MKKYLILFIAAISMSVFTGCETDDDFNPPNFVTFDRNVVNYAVTQNGTGSFEVTVFAANVTNTDRTVTINVDPASTLASSAYSIPATVTIPANSNEATFTVDLTDDGISNSGDTLIFSLGTLEGLYVGAPLRANISRNCPSNLDVAFDWVATSSQFDGELTGSDAFVKVASTVNRYKTASGVFDFGYYCVAYGDCAEGDGARGTLTLVDTCGNLTYIGTDQYGDAWTISNVVVDESDLTFTWRSAYGETSTVTLTRTDGENWPVLM